MFLRFALILFLLFSTYVKSQDGFTKKQLLDLIAKPANDTTLINAYNELCWPVYSYDLTDSSIYYAQKAIALAEKTNDIKRLSIAHRRLGITYINTGDLKKAIFHQEESYALSEKINFKRGMQLALNNIGVVYLNNDLLNKALSYFLRSLKIVEENKDFSRVSNLYSNCGMIYRRTGDYKKALVYYAKAKYYSKLENNQESLVSINCNLSTIYRNMNLLDSALFYSTEAKKHLDDKTNTAAKYNYYLNEGLLFSFTKQHEKALTSFLNCQNLVTNVSDEATLLINIGEEYKKLNDSEKTIQYFKKAYDVSEKNNLFNNLQYLSLILANHFQSKKDLLNYSAMINHHLNYRDSNEKYTRVQQIQQQQLEFDYARKQVADSLKFQQKENLKNIQLEVAAAKLNKEKSFKIMLLIVLVIIVIFSIFIFNRFVLTNRQKKIIERQKQIVEIKNHEILDSINYAKRLQEAILPQIADIKKELQFDILYLPKDIIGGDFYFFEKDNEHLYIAVCDCTGHGIPGALMSVVCHQALRKSIKEFSLNAPDLILAKTRQIIIESLNASNQNIQDGMDCSLLVINKLSRQMKWAGAYNPLWMLHNKTFTEITADKQPVALYENAKDFSKHNLELESGTLLYLFTDGFADQFGGEKGKKYKQKQLKEFLSSISEFTLEKQMTLLHQNFNDWKGSLDQVDDVTIAVIKV